MRFLFVVLLFNGALSFAQTGHAITNVNIINVMNPNEISPEQTVLIARGKIRRIGPAKAVKIPKDFIRIDGTGKYLIPGLWDMHVHLSYYGDEALQMLIENGVTTVRDMGGDLTQIDRWRKGIKDGTIGGPSIFRAGPFVDGPNKMDSKTKALTKVVKNDKDARAAVADLKALNVDFISIQDHVSKAAFFALADEARKQKISLSVNVSNDLLMTAILNAGVRSIEHIESLPGVAIHEEDPAIRDRMTGEAIRRLETDSILIKMRKNKVYFDPTLVTLYPSKDGGPEKDRGPQWMPWVARLYKSGVPLLVGSGFTTREAGIVPGTDLHRELELFVQAGMLPIDVLRSATIGAAKFMGVDGEAGSVTEGKRADLVLLDANPLKDISNTRKISRVFLNGNMVDK